MLFFFLLNKLYLQYLKLPTCCFINFKLMELKIKFQLISRNLWIVVCMIPPLPKIINFKVVYLFGFYHYYSKYLFTSSPSRSSARDGISVPTQKETILGRSVVKNKSSDRTRPDPFVFLRFTAGPLIIHSREIIQLNQTRLNLNRKPNFS